MVLEVMGRYAGWIAIYAGLAGGADVILIPEIPFNYESICNKVGEREQAGKHFTIVVVAQVLFGGRLDYYRWSAIFAPQWMRVLAFVTIVSLLYHVWVGMRDIWMDYVKPVSIRLLLDIATIVWLVGCAGWAIQVLWRL